MRRASSLSLIVPVVLLVIGSLPACASVFRDDLDGTPGVNIVGTTPEVGGSAWANGGQVFDQIHFAAGGGVEDVGPNSRNSNTYASSTLLSPYTLSTLAAGEVLHLQVTMANIAGTPSANPFESSRVDFVTNTSGGFISLGEFDTNRNWGASSAAGNPIFSRLPTAQAGSVLLDLYLDPNDVFADGAMFNAILTVNGGCRIGGKIVGLSTSTTLSEVRLLRNVDDEVFFDDISVEAVPAPIWSSTIFQDDLSGTPGANIVGTTPEIGGAAWTNGGLIFNQLHFVTGGGVQDDGPNSRSTNTYAGSTLLSPFALSTLAASEVLHLQVTMANISATPAGNPFESSRVDLVTNTSGGVIALGEFGTGGKWGAGAQAGNLMASNLSTAQSGLYLLDLYLDPTDAYGDGPTFNAIVTVNGGQPITGTIVGLSGSTTISEVRLVRNVDDEVFFQNVLVERSCLPPSVLVAGIDPGASVVGQAIAYPNPFRDSVGLLFSQPKPGPVDVAVYDITGRLVQRVSSEGFEEGTHYVTWDGLDSDGIPVKSGIYFMRVQSPTEVITRKVVRVK